MNPFSVATTDTTPILISASNADLLRRCIRILRKHTRASYRLYVVDDCSPSVGLHKYLNKLERSDQAVVFRSDTRRGFAGIHNWAVKQIPSSSYICLLSPDTVVGEHWLLYLLHEMSLDPKVGLVGSRSSPNGQRKVEKDGAIQEGPHPNEEVAFFQACVHRGVDLKAGAYILIRREVWEQLGGFDLASSKGQLEDENLCYRVHRAGWKIICQARGDLYSYEPTEKKWDSMGEENLKFLVKWKRPKKGSKGFPSSLVSVIVVNYNTRRITADCLKSVLEKTICSFELIVVDNGSKDDSIIWLEKIAKYPGVGLIANKENRGWTAANNQGIKVARGRYYLLLNSDTIVQTEGWLGNMIRLARPGNVGTVGAKLLYPDGKIQHIGGSIHARNPFHPYDGAPADIPASLKVREVPFNTGACLLIKKSTIEKVGLLDEGYFLGYSDVEYGLRCLEQGLKNLYCPSAILTHLWAYSQRKSGQFISTDSLARFHRLWSDKLPILAGKTVIDWDWPVCAQWNTAGGPGTHIIPVRDESGEKRMGWGLDFDGE